MGERLGDVVIDVRRAQRRDQRIGAGAHTVGEDPPRCARHRESTALTR
jgi:hypothetical protein